MRAGLIGQSSRQKRSDQPPSILVVGIGSIPVWRPAVIAITRLRPVTVVARPVPIHETVRIAASDFPRRWPLGDGRAAVVSIGLFASKVFLIVGRSKTLARDSAGRSVLIGVIARAASVNGSRWLSVHIFGRPPALGIITRLVLAQQRRRRAAIAANRGAPHVRAIALWRKVSSRQLFAICVAARLISWPIEIWSRPKMSAGRRALPDFGNRSAHDGAIRCTHAGVFR